jgi:hypothetical protein
MCCKTKQLPWRNQVSYLIGHSLFWQLTRFISGELMTSGELKGSEITALDVNVLRLWSWQPELLLFLHTCTLYDTPKLSATYIYSPSLRRNKLLRQSYFLFFFKFDAPIASKLLIFVRRLMADSWHYDKKISVFVLALVIRSWNFRACTKAVQIYTSINNYIDYIPNR